MSSGRSRGIFDGLPIPADKSKSIADKFMERMVAWAKNIKVSDPFEEGCRLGPVVSEGQYEKIKKFISNAKSEVLQFYMGVLVPREGILH